MDSKKAQILYGRKAVAQVLQSAPDSLRRVYRASGSRLEPNLEQLLAAAATKGLELKEVDTEFLNELCEANDAQGARAQGIVAELKERPTLTLEELAANSLSPTGNALLVVLDQVADPQNFGSVLRAAAAAGADGVVCTVDRSAPLTPVARKASAGASELLPIVSVKNLQRALGDLKQQGFWILGTAIDDTASVIYDAELPSPAAVIFGSEGKGMRRIVKEQCDILLEIPMNNSMQSLNVGQAAATVLFELVRQRREK